ncbi:MAG: ABC transporter ATP-binding protein [Planctomycetes bacterium]|nr:ABC transporter ATP-binding protein [Planctomycetota bacterium]
MPAVEIRDIRKTFKDFFGRRRIQALDGLSISVQAGEVYGLLGPNGSGKTTTFKIALGLIRPDTGSVTVLGNSPGSLAARKATGYLPEDSTLLPFLSARESLRLHGALAGLSRADSRRKTDELLDKVGLRHAADRRVLGFSKGMQRRLGIASVLIGDPQVFILDEPTSGLDPLGAVEMKHLIADLRKQGKAVLISSHLLGELENVCDRVAFLNHGKLINEGTLDELLREKETHELRVSPADGESIRALEDLARQRGLTVISSKAPMRSLEAFYLSVLGKDRPK